MNGAIGFFAVIIVLIIILAILASSSFRSSVHRSTITVYTYTQL